ncbi:hypothetical protein MKZ38_008574 [Zalerion maritima]|uniref:Pru domain-containing protein n=1 Tax=Zalerion maritima TaxID=339359 RepID=A0AAD5RYE5_9PEZI|nr:hypothetical protein MKZ38_008574 [Zalerion maritima]
MSITPVLTFKAGQCELDTSSKPYKVTASPTPGYIYLYKDEAELTHFCWRPRDKLVDDPDNLDLIMVPTDGNFVANDYKIGDPPSTKTNGRIFVLKFSSSSHRHLFWLQSKSQSPDGDNSWYSPRDLKIGEIVDRMLQGEEDIDVNAELAAARNSGNRRDDDDDDDDDETMEDVEGHGDRNDPHTGGSGGAGPGATGGDVREEGENAREGGADGARAASGGNLDAEASEAVRNLLASLGAGGASGSSTERKYPALHDLLPTSETIPMVQALDETQTNKLLDFLPPTTIVLTQAGGADVAGEPSSDTVEAARLSMSLGEKKDLVSRVLRSPQFTQSLASLTIAIRDGGLPTLAEALQIQVENGGYMRRGGVPLGGGDAVKAFVEGVKKTVKEGRIVQGTVVLFSGWMVAPPTKHPCSPRHRSGAGDNINRFHIIPLPDFLALQHFLHIDWNIERLGHEPIAPTALHYSNCRAGKEKMGLLNPKPRGREPPRQKFPLYNEKAGRKLRHSYRDASFSDVANDHDDGWSTESSLEGGRGSSLDQAGAYMLPKSGRGTARLQKKQGPRFYRLPNKVVRCLCVALMTGIIIFILALVRASKVENQRIADGHGKDQLPQIPPPPKPWETFPFLKRYYGGIRTLVSLNDNVPEYPREEDEVPLQGSNATARALPGSKDFASYSSAGLDHDFTECFIDEQGTVRVPGLRYYEGRPNGFPDNIFGSYEALNLPEEICFERYGKMGPYGLGYAVKEGGTGAGRHGDQEGSQQVWSEDGKVNYSKVNWADIQRRCYRANSNRFPPVQPKQEVPGFYIGDEPLSKTIEARDTPKASSNTTTQDVNQKSEVQHGDKPRSALVLRCWDTFTWREEDILNLRSLISELSLASGGRYDVHILVQVHNDAQYPVMADPEAYERRVRDTVPKEFQGIVTLWTVTQMLSLYQGIHDNWIKGPEMPVHGEYRGLQMAMQHFASSHPEYEYVWHWEMDLRYTGHYLDLLTKTENWAREQPRKGIWERSGRFYFPSVHGTWEDFRQMARVQSEMGTPDQLPKLPNQPPAESSNQKPIWGPVRSADENDHFEPDKDPVPPHSYDKDKYEWGVGEEADLITFSPIFDPDGTTWGLREDITGYNTTEGLPPRRAHIITASRMSRKLLMTMHRETAYVKHFAFSEMWPATVALQHGFKAVYAPHPVFVDREWPTEYMSSVLNAGANGAVGGARTSVYGEREHNLAGVTFFYNSGFGRNLWERWLGQRVNNDGGEGFETTKDESKTGDSVGQMKGGEGRMCLPPMLVHPVRDLGLPLEVVHKEPELPPETDPSA